MTHSIAIACFAFYFIASIAYLAAVVSMKKRPFRLAEMLLAGAWILQSILIPSVLQTRSGPPLLQRGEYFFWLTWAVPLVYFIYRKRLGTPLVGSFLAPCALLFLASSSYLLHLETPLGGRELSRSLLLMHVVPALFAELSLVIVFGASAAYVIQESRIRRKLSSSVVWPGPSLDSLDSIAQRFVLLGFLAMGWAVLSGAIWAISMRYSLLSGDFYQWAAILNWVVLASIFYLRTHLAWSAARLSRITLILAGAMLVGFLVFAFVGGNEAHITYGV